eukprot:SAG31_NODE_302_length_18087_cov_97.056982_14_plen_151_part_00
MQTANPDVADYVSRLLSNGYRTPRSGGHDDKAHPPIHPTAFAPGLQGNEKKVYDFVVRHFLACCSEDAQGERTEVAMELAEEEFVASGLMVKERKYLEVYVWEKWSTSTIPTFQLGQRIAPSLLMLQGSQTGAKFLFIAEAAVSYSIAST